MCIVAMFFRRLSVSWEVGCPTSPTQYAVHSGGRVKPIQLSTIMMLPMTLSAPSSLPVITMPATLPLIALRPLALYSSSRASSRSITRCMRLERPPHQIGVQKSTMSAALIRATRPGQSSCLASWNRRPTGSVASESRTTVASTGASARSSSSTSSVSSPVLERSGSCLSDALRARTLSGASDGMPQRKQGLVLYTGPHPQGQGSWWRRQRQRVLRREEAAMAPAEGSLAEERVGHVGRVAVVAPVPLPGHLAADPPTLVHLHLAIGAVGVETGKRAPAGRGPVKAGAACRVETGRRQPLHRTGGPSTTRRTGRSQSVPRGVGDHVSGPEQSVAGSNRCPRSAPPRRGGGLAGGPRLRVHRYRGRRGPLG